MTSIKATKLSHFFVYFTDKQNRPLNVYLITQTRLVNFWERRHTHTHLRTQAYTSIEAHLCNRKKGEGKVREWTGDRLTNKIRSNMSGE